MHLVDKHIFDISYDNESTAIDMQRRISSISNDALFDTISEVFDEFDVPTTVRIPRLELNIGSIRESNLQEDLLEAVAASLRSQLAEYIDDYHTNAESTSSDESPKNDLGIFEQFMISGTVPWWIRDRNAFDIRKEIDSALERDLANVAAVVRKHASRPYFLERLVYNLSQAQLERLIQALAPNEAKQVIEAAKNIEKVQQKRKVVATDNRTYRNKIWEFVLTYLLIDRGTAFNQKMFVQATLARLAHHFNIEYGTFLELFYTAIQDIQKEISVPTGLVAIINEIYGERTLVETKKQGVKQESAGEITAVYTALLTTNTNFDSRFEAQLLELIQSKSVVFASFINREADNALLHKNIAKALSDRGMYQLVQFIEPTSQKVVIQFSHKVQHLKESSSISISGSSQEFRDAKWEFIIRALLSDRGSQFNLKSFVRATLSSLAAHFNIALEDLMHYVLLELNASDASDKGSLASALLEIKEEELQKADTEAAEEKEIYLAKIKFQWLEYALVHGEIPSWSARRNLNLADFQQILFDVIEEQATTAQRMLRVQLRENRKRHFLIRQLDDKGRHGIVRFLNAQAAEKITLYDQLLDKIQERRNVAANKQEFESLKWSTILEILTEEKGSVFNYKTFVMRSLLQLSNRLNVSFETLFSYVLEVSSTLPNMPESPLQNALIALQTEWNSAKSKKHDEKTELNTALQEVWNQLKKDVPEQARYLIILLDKLKRDAVFRGQLDIYEWLKQRPEITPEIFQSIIQSMRWNADDMALLMQHQSDNSISKLLDQFGGQQHSFVQYYLNDLATLLRFSFGNYQTLSKQAYLFAVAFFTTNIRVDKHQFFKELLQFLSRFQGVSSDTMLLQLQASLKTEAPELNSTLALSISKLVHAEEEDLAIEITQPEASETTEDEQPEQEEINEETLEEFEETEEDLSSVYVENAGIVILWPFFRQLFKMLEMVEDDAFVSIAAKIRGVHLLQYMCTGETSHPEHELLLNKILCGIPTNIPIDDSFEISPKEKEVIDSMLLGTIANWPRMKDSSVDALRETFLIRSAKISFEEETVDMHVEKKTVDVLFDSMPWSFTFVNLPWMRKPLRTIWN